MKWFKSDHHLKVYIVQIHNNIVTMVTLTCSFRIINTDKRPFLKTSHIFNIFQKPPVLQ